MPIPLVLLDVRIWESTMTYSKTTCFKSRIENPFFSYRPSSPSWSLLWRVSRDLVGIEPVLTPRDFLPACEQK